MQIGNSCYCISLRLICAVEKNTFRIFKQSEARDLADGGARPPAFQMNATDGSCCWSWKDTRLRMNGQLSIRSLQFPQ